MHCTESLMNRSSTIFAAQQVQAALVELEGLAVKAAHHDVADKLVKQARFLLETDAVRLDANLIEDSYGPTQILWEPYVAVLRLLACGDVTSITPLLLATGDPVLLQRLVEIHNAPELRLHDLFMEMVKEGRIDAVRTLLADARLNPSAALIVAARAGHANIVRLLAMDPRTDVVGEVVLTRVHCPALVAACAAGQIETVRVLLEICPREHMCLSTLIEAAAMHGFTDIVRLLFENDENGHAGVVGFVTACRHGHIDIVRFLHPHCQGRVVDGVLAASKMGHVEIVRLIAEPAEPAVAEPVAAPVANEEHLFVRGMRFFRAIVPQIPNEGPDEGPEEGPDEGLDEFPVVARNNVEIERYEPGNNFREYVPPPPEHANPPVRAGDFTEALQAAIEGGHTEIVAILLGSGRVSPSHSENEALRTAVLQNKLEIVRLLLEYNGPFPVNPAAEENAPLRLASANGFTEIVRLLLERGVVDDVSGRAITLACSGGHTEIVSLLIALSVPTRLADLIRKASSRGHTDVVQLLMAYL